MDRYVEVSRQGWLSRIGNSFMGALLGAVLVLASFWLLWWNEGRAVERADSIAAGASAVALVSAASVDADNEGKLVHFTGELAASGPANDDTFGVSTDGVRLRREVEVYQWKEHVETKTKKNLGGSETKTKTYTYTEEWTDRYIDSGRFEHPKGHHNPAPDFETKTFDAPDIKVGAFSMPRELVVQYDEFSNTLPASEAQAPASHRATVDENILYLGEDPSRPVVGDMRVTFTYAKATTVSVLGQQQGDSLGTWRGDGHELEPRLEVGTLSAEAMFDQLQAENERNTWLLRGLGFLLMFIGFAMILRPLSVVADFIPLIGSIVGFGGAVASFLVAAVLSLGTIAVAWVRFRPLVGVPLLLGTGFLAFVLLRRGRKKKD